MSASIVAPQAKVPIRILIVEDHVLLAELLQEALDSEVGISVVGVATTCSAGERMAKQTRPDVILMDYHLPDGNGADLALRVRQFSPRTAIVIVTSDTTEEALRYAIAAGAVGYLPKSSRPATVIEGVRRAAAGEILMTPEALRLLASPAVSASAQSYGLTRREAEVLRLMCAGRDTKGIAADLGIEYNTARGHAQRVLEKMDVRTRLEAVVRARESGSHAGR